MFEQAELGRQLSKEEYEQALPGLRTDLLQLQNELRVDPRFAVLVLISGVDGAGKGETVNILHEWMDPRYLEAYAFGPRTTEELERPPHWRFWRDLPPKGRVGIFFGSWYTDPIVQRVYGQTKDAELEAALTRINLLEQYLTADGILLLKFWFHLAKDVQKRRLKSLARDPRQSWRVTKTDWKHFELYDRFSEISARALRETDTGSAPWHIIEGADPRYRQLTAGRILLAAMQARREALKKPQAPRRSARISLPAGRQPTLLSTLDMKRTLDRSSYETRMASLQGELNLLSRKAHKRGVAMVMVFEGCDAAGKGGAIRRVTRALDARFYKVIPIAAPSDEEKARHYLWRFWRRLPRFGHTAIFDRSWYGRVLVERVEGYASEEEWRRAYKEINDFEEHLHDHGTALVKFWLNITKEEQLRRFKEREKTSYKQFKITAEDYRNRNNWGRYEEAVNEMIARTGSEYAPWTLVEANDKRHARVKILQTCCDTLRAALKRKKRRSSEK